MSRRHIALLLLAVVACRDAAEDPYARAKARHEELLLAGARPEAKGFDDVLADCAKVPAGSPHYAQAQTLARAILAGREHLRAPLAITASGAQHADVAAQLALCAQLAKVAGLDGGLSRSALEAIDHCRERAEKLDIVHLHADAPP